MKDVLQGFRKFILRGNVIDLAVGVIVGASFNTVVTSLVTNLISPLLGVAGGIPELSKLAFTVLGVTFRYGLFLNSLLSFLITAAVVYFFVVLPVNRLTRLTEQQDAKMPAPESCPYCRKDIDPDATRCPYCTSQVKRPVRKSA